ncbi:MAG: YicC family protein [Oscillospiraceae bacterium]|nr:YicC family protein [Oscillospiraceae bacterium]
MILSMTGYGSAKGRAAGLGLTLELRSVNNRYLDLNVRMPRGFLFAEDCLKSCIQSRVSRGKVDVFVTLDSDAGADALVHVNAELASSYRAAVQRIGEIHGLPDSITALDLARFPEVLSLEKQEVDKELFLSELKELADAAVDDFNAMRVREGERLKEDLLSKAERMEALVGEIEQRAPETVRIYRNRLEQKLREVLGDTSLPEERIVTEAAVFADRVATDEELVRLKSHLSQLRGMLDSGSPIGRKLDFLIQEFNREANTIGSKCQDSAIAYLVVDLKSEIEKVREQVQNIE